MCLPASSSLKTPRADRAASAAKLENGVIRCSVEMPKQDRFIRLSPLPPFLNFFFRVISFQFISFDLFINASQWRGCRTSQ